MNKPHKWKNVSLDRSCAECERCGQVRMKGKGGYKSIGKPRPACPGVRKEDRR